MPNYLSLSTINKFVPLARKLGVSTVARGSGGFLSAYRRADGNPDRLSDQWAKKRDAFVARHMAQVKQGGESLWDDGLPSRRHLALIMWAYSPNPSKLSKTTVQETPTMDETPRAGNPTTKPGKHGTLYLYRITYKDAHDPGAPEFAQDTWAYNLEHIDDITQDWPEDGWQVLSVARVPEGGAMHRAIKHRTNETSSNVEARSNDVVGEYHTRSGKVGMIIYRHVRRHGVVYDYSGEWGAGSGHGEAEMQKMVRDMLEQRRGVRVITPFNTARELNETSHHVSDFTALDDLIAHARDDGATHVVVDGPNTTLYYPRGGKYPYEEATVWRKAGYWHAQGPGARTGVTGLPEDAREISGGRGRRAAETSRTRWPDWMILETIEQSGGMTPQAQDRAFELIELGYIDATGTWELTDKGRQALSDQIENVEENRRGRRTAEATKKPRTGTPVRYKNDIFEVLAWDGDFRTRDMMHGRAGGKDKGTFWTHDEARAFAEGFMQRNKPRGRDASVRISETSRRGDTDWHELWLSNDGVTWTFAGTGRYADKRSGNRMAASRRSSRNENSDPFHTIREIYPDVSFESWMRPDQLYRAADGLDGAFIVNKITGDVKGYVVAPWSAHKVPFTAPGGRNIGGHAQRALNDWQQSGNVRERRVEDYVAVDRRGRTLGGPFKSYSEADDAAGTAGVVKFVPSRTREAPMRPKARGSARRRPR